MGKASCNVAVDGYGQAASWVTADGNNIPVGVLNTISNITGSTFDEDSIHVEMSSEESKMVMLSSIQGETRFDKYDPLGIIDLTKSFSALSTMEVSVATPSAS